MKSPFPGMDPYIEGCGLWGDFHLALIMEIKTALSRSAPERYLVRTGERSYLVLVESEGKKDYSFVPDVSIAEPRGRGKDFPRRGTAVSEPASDAESVTMRALVEEEHREAFVEIYESSPGHRLVTCIEVLSPSNKRRRSKGWKLYLRKRRGCLVGDVNLVEIDLLRGGQRMPMIDPWPDSPYTLLVHRGTGTQLCRVWPAHYHKPLPAIPVPLMKPDGDLTLELQPMIEAIYERYRYAASIDYRKPLTPPLPADAAAWLKQQMKRRKAHG